ncbi:MAG: hypothetical protein LBP60_05060 [Spirochaetaceae bacterium]|jgi:hypothetical protein|nr:hypothetical protein [Spirochaetaceae bacterium]
MKTRIIRFVCLLALWPFLVSCDQEPLFYDISMEIPPIEPVIGGGPSRIVEYGGNLYVSNGTVWEYNSASWYKMPSQPPSGNIKALAQTTSYLFALGWNGTLWRWDGTNWTSIGTGGTQPEQIFGVGTDLFAGAKTGAAGTADGYCILTLNGSDTNLFVIASSTGLLMGAASDGSDVFLGILGKGVVIATSPTAIIPGSAASIIGLYKHGSVIVAVTTGGALLYYDSLNFNTLLATGSIFSGAMASWSHGTDTMLLLGIQNSSGAYGYGYRELHWNGNISSLSSASRSLYYPGEGSPSSVVRDIQYTTAIGNHAVMALYVRPAGFSPAADGDGRPIIFASTVKDGLWAYRTRDGRPQWNGEDNGS